ncbi:MAG: hypothetical protein AAF226_01860 [Verrucomicrobiota bacterium]
MPPRLFAIFLFCLFPLTAQEQKHGFTFENWVLDTFFDGYRGDYTQKWDVPAEVNKINNLPISIKTCKYGSSIGLGDIVRQRQVSEPFILLVGFWKQSSEDEKSIVAVEAMHFTPEKWNALWGTLTLEKIQQLDTIVKNREINYVDAREIAKAWKDQHVPDDCQFGVHQKIGSTGQRRVQCSISFKTFWQIAGREPDPATPAILWEKTCPSSMDSKARFGE